MIKSIIIAFIKGYRFILSPFLGQNCRFYPTCSAYSIEAFEKHGVFKGVYLSIKRILKCHPWYKGEMVDPVPTKEHKK